MQNQTAAVGISRIAEAELSSGIAVQSLISRIWPGVLVFCGFGLTLVWASFLGYGLVRLHSNTFLRHGSDPKNELCINSIAARSLGRANRDTSVYIHSVKSICFAFPFGRSAD